MLSRREYWSWMSGKRYCWPTPLFQKTFGLKPEALINTKTSALNWRQWANGDDRTDLPWRTAIEFRRTGDRNVYKRSGAVR